MANLVYKLASKATHRISSSDAFATFCLSKLTLHRNLMKTPETISPERQYNTRLGLILFVVYLLLYLGFVLGSAFLADAMETKVLFGLNLAIVYGFALIKMAFILSLIYGWMCRVEPVDSSSNTVEKKETSQSSLEAGCEEKQVSKEGEQ